MHLRKIFAKAGILYNYTTRKMKEKVNQPKSCKSIEEGSFEYWGLRVFNKLPLKKKWNN